MRCAAASTAGASLYYETFGSGPLLLMISGADGRGSIFHQVAQHLSSHFTVACWDRRRFSQSILRGSQDFANRLNTDADDAERLISRLSGPAIVFGTSSGAVVAQTLLTRHPESVKLVVAHEPPSFNVLPREHSKQASNLIHHIYDTYRSNGPTTAMEVFTGGLSAGKDGLKMRECMDPGRGDEIRANSLYWFEFELRQYPLANVDVDGIVREKNKYLPAAGVDSGDNPGVAPVSAIAAAVGKDVARLPGGHVGFMTHADEWVAGLLALVQPLI